MYTCSTQSFRFRGKTVLCSCGVVGPGEPGPEGRRTATHIGTSELSAWSWWTTHGSDPCFSVNTWLQTNDLFTVRQEREIDVPPRGPFLFCASTRWRTDRWTQMNIHTHIHTLVAPGDWYLGPERSIWHQLWRMWPQAGRWRSRYIRCSVFQYKHNVLTLFGEACLSTRSVVVLRDVTVYRPGSVWIHRGAESPKFSGVFFYRPLSTFQTTNYHDPPLNPPPPPPSVPRWWSCVCLTVSVFVN